MHRRLLVILLFLFSACGASQEPVLIVDEEFARHFEEAGVTGTIVVYDVHGGRRLVHNPERAQERFIPASTFKIPHSLIALQLEAVADTSTVLEWDGRQRWLEAWNRDHSMTSAFRHSTVWFYQETARRIGERSMREQLERIGYGNADIGGGIDRFWLDGDLRISAHEQVDFLSRLHAGDLPFDDAVMEDVRDVMVEERGRDHVLRAKTGWAELDGPDVGWYVGWVERKDGPTFFALNMEMDGVEHAPLRKDIVKAILRDMGVLPAG